MLALNFNATNGSLDQYQRILDGLGERHLAPAGRILHVCSATPTGFHVLDLWRSDEEFSTFAQHLGPLIASVGLDTVPEITPAHHAVLHSTAAPASAPVTAIFDVAAPLASYDAIRAKLGVAHEAPLGRRIHVSHPTASGFRVIGVWDSEEHLRAYLPSLRVRTEAAGLTAIPQLFRTHALVTHVVF